MQQSNWNSFCSKIGTIHEKKVQTFHARPVTKPTTSRTVLESSNESQNFYGDCKVNQSKRKKTWTRTSRRFFIIKNEFFHVEGKSCGTNARWSCFNIKFIYVPIEKWYHDVLVAENEKRLNRRAEEKFSCIIGQNKFERRSTERLPNKIRQ